MDKNYKIVSNKSQQKEPAMNTGTVDHAKKNVINVRLRGKIASLPKLKRFRGSYYVQFAISVDHGNKYFVVTTQPNGAYLSSSLGQPISINATVNL